VVGALLGAGADMDATDDVSVQGGLGAVEGVHCRQGAQGGAWRGGEGSLTRAQKKAATQLYCHYDPGACWTYLLFLGACLGA
jgi:hypothetical protein